MRNGFSVFAIFAAVWAAVAERGGLPLKVGDKAPPFRLIGTDGKEYTLAEFAGKSAVVLVWYPKAMTPGCTTQCNSLRDEFAILSRYKARVFGVSVDSVAANQRFTQKHGYGFTLLSDPDKKTARAYGVLGPLGFARRWTFVIDDQGIIRAIDKQVKPANYGSTLARMLSELGIPRVD